MFRSFLAQCCHGYKPVSEDTAPVPAPLVIANPLIRQQPHQYQGNRWYPTETPHRINHQDDMTFVGAAPPAWYGSTGIHPAHPAMMMGQPPLPHYYDYAQSYHQQPPPNTLFTVHSAGNMGFVYETRLVQSGLVVANPAATAAVEDEPVSSNTAIPDQIYGGRSDLTNTARYESKETNTTLTLTKARRRRRPRPTPTTVQWEPTIRRPSMTVDRPLTTSLLPVPSYIVELSRSGVQTEELRSGRVQTEEVRSSRVQTEEVEEVPLIDLSSPPPPAQKDAVKVDLTVGEVSTGTESRDQRVESRDQGAQSRETGSRNTEVVSRGTGSRDDTAVEADFQKLVLERSCSRPEDLLAESMADESPVEKEESRDQSRDEGIESRDQEDSALTVQEETVAMETTESVTLLTCEVVPLTPEVALEASMTPTTPIESPVTLIEAPATPEVKPAPRRSTASTPMSPILTAGFEWCEDYEYELVECGEGGEEEEEGEGALELEPNFELDSPFNNDE